MKKFASLFLIVSLVFALSVPVFAATTRAADTRSEKLSLSISNGIATSYLYIEAFSSTTRISGTFQLKRGNTVLQESYVDGYGTVSNPFVCSGLFSGNYTATFSGTCGRDSIDLSSSYRI